MGDGTSALKVIFFQDKELLISWNENKKIILWDINRTKKIKIFKCDIAVDKVIILENHQQFISLHSNNMFKLWDINSGKVIHVYRHDDYTDKIQEFRKGLVISRDENKILSWTLDSSVKIWSRLSGTLINEFKHVGFTRDEYISGTIFSNDEKKILTWNNNKLFLWNIEEKKIQFSFEHERVKGAFFSKDDKYIVSWGYDNIICLWDTSNGKILKRFKHNGYIHGASFSKDESTVLSWGADKDVILWDINSTIPIQKLRHDNYHEAIFSKDENEILSWSGNVLRLWRLDIVGEEPITFPYNSFIRDAFFSKNGKKILSWSENELRVWDKYNNKKPSLAITLDEEIIDARFIMEEKRIITIMKSGFIKVWDITSSHKDLDLSIEYSDFSKKKDIQLSWKENILELKDMISGIVLHAYNHKEFIVKANFSLDGKNIFCRSSKVINIWSLKDNSLLKKIEETKLIQNAILSSDSQYILINLKDNTFKLYNTSTQESPIIFREKYKLYVYLLKNKIKITGLDKVFKTVYQRIISTEDAKKTLFISGEGSEIQLYDNYGTNFLKSFTHKGYITGVMFLKNETNILSWGGYDIKVWDIQSQQLIKDSFTSSKDNNIEDVGFLEKEKQLLVLATQDNGISVIRLWDFEKDEILKIFFHGKTLFKKIIFSKNKQYFLAYSSNKIGLWDIRMKKPLSIVSIEKPLKGVMFLKEKNNILYWTEDKVFNYSFYRNLHLDTSHYPLKIQVETGTYLTPSGEVKALTKNEWEAKKKEYEEILAEAKD